MTELTPAEIDEVMEQGRAHDPLECGGLILARGLKKRRLHPLTNRTRERKACRFDPCEVRAAETDGWAIQALYHTHVRQTLEPSDVDRVTCTAMGIPWVIVGYPNRRQRWLYPCPGATLPLIGREFHHGTIDCYTLIRDYYSQTLGLELPDFYREDDWWMKGQNVYLDNLEAAGFIGYPRDEAGDIRQHDVLLMKMAPSAARLRVPSHGAVYLGASKIAHHYAGCLSQRTFLSQFYWRRTSHIARHRSLA